MDDRQVLVTHIESLLDLLAYWDRGEVAPADLQARVYRAETDHGDHEYAEKRAALHSRVAEGDDLAGEVLELLSDDPSWRASEP